MRRGEIDGLRGLSHLAVVLYAIGLRPRCVDGVAVASWSTLARDVSVAAMPGAPGDAIDASRVRRALGALVRVGLVVVSGRGFELPLSIRPPDARPTWQKLQADKAAASNGAALRPEADKGQAVRPTGVEVDEMQADKVKRSSGAGLSVEADKVAVRSFSHDGAPLPPPSHSPPITPSLLSPHLSPTLAARARENEFTLTAPPSEDPQPKLIGRAEEKTRIPQPFMPTLATIKALEQKGVAQALALGEVGHFAAWWLDQGGQAGHKRASGWQLAFLNWCLKLAPKTGSTGARNHGNHRPSASERNAEAIRRARADRRT